MKRAVMELASYSDDFVAFIGSKMLELLGINDMHIQFVNEYCLKF